MVTFEKKGVHVSPLFCDKLAFVIQYKTADARAFVRERLKYLRHNSEGHFAYPGGGRKYKLGMHFYVEPYERVSTMLVQADPKYWDDHFIRVDYNPAHADPGTIFWLLDQILPEGWSDIPLLAKCTRFDATVDVHRIDIMELLVSYSGMQLNRLFCKGGRFETVEFGRYDGDKRVVVYDKRAEVIHWNEKHAIKKPVPSSPTTRIEIVLRPSRTFAALADISNPFSGLSVLTTPSLSEAATLPFRLFVKVAQLGGLQQALLGLPESTRKGFKAVLAKSSCSWWNPDTIWSSWNDLILELLHVPKPAKSPVAALQTEMVS